MDEKRALKRDRVNRCMEKLWGEEAQKKVTKSEENHIL